MNKLLCKYFDPDKKGYVTIGDVTIKIMQYLICIIITTFILYSMYISAAYPILYDANTTIVEFLSDIVGSIAWIIIIIIIGLFIVVNALELTLYISEIKIAKCKIQDAARLDNASQAKTKQIDNNSEEVQESSV